MVVVPLFRVRPFGPEAIQAMHLAYERTCTALQLSGSADMLTEIVATKIIELAQCGEDDPAQLTRRVLEALQAEMAAVVTGQRADPDGALRIA